MRHGTIILTIVLAASLFAFGAALGQQKVIQIGVLQFASHPALDQSRDGFIDFLAQAGYKDGEKIKLDLQNAQRDMSVARTIAKKFVSDNKDLIFSIATPASQAAAKETGAIPIVFSAVTDPVKAGLVKSVESSGNNVTGVSDLIPVKTQIELLLKIAPRVKRLGIIYNAGEDNARVLVEMTRAAAKELKLSLVEKTVTNSGEVFAATQTMIGSVDGIYTIQDNTVISALESVIKVANNNRLPVLVPGIPSVERGGLATVGTSFYNLGKIAGDQAVRIIKGTKPSDIPVAFVKDFDIYLNQKAADEIGIKFPEDLRSKAKKIY
ncbi:MAG: ABC transporter substrate-binding protein [Deltaproteobacteria bacterium]|nr:MAG: ABC transporter substrate-binding protein [Deltaproteobacteria bacterium]